MFGLKSWAYAYAAPKNRHSNCRQAIVFLRHGNNCVYKWTAEIWGSKEMRGQIGNDSWRSEFVEGRICLELGKIQFSAVTQKADFSGLLSFQSWEMVFWFARICASSFQEHLLVCLLLTNEREKRRWRSYRVLCGKSTGIPSIWPHFQLNYICLTSSTWIHRTGHMGIAAASSEAKLNLVHYNIMSKEKKLYLGMIAQLNWVLEGFCLKQMDFFFFFFRYIQTHTVNMWVTAQDLSMRNMVINPKINSPVVWSRATLVN